MKRSRGHSSDEFGKQGSGLAGMDAPMIGAAGAIFSDALSERESGSTPPPPPVSVRTLAIVFAVMFVAGLAGLYLVLAPHHSAGDASHSVPDFRFAYSAAGTGRIAGDFESRGANAFLVANSLADTGNAVHLDPQLSYDSSTAFVVNGKPASLFTTRRDALSVYDVSGWPVSVTYVRVPGSVHPRAVRVEFVVPDSRVQAVIHAHR